MTRHIAAVTPERTGDPVRDLRARVEAEMETFGLSRARAAAEMGAGVSSGTLSLWLAGTYAGDNAAVAERLERWLETRAERAAHAFGGARLDAHAATSAARQVAAAAAYAQAAGDIALVHGPSGRGKSWSARRHVETRASAYVVCATPAMTTLPRLLGRLAAVVAAGGRHGSSIDAEAAIVAALQGRGALVVIDEAHHLRAALLDELRCIRDQAGCGVLLIGDDSVLMTLACCPQVRGRVGMTVALDRVGRDDVRLIAASTLGRQPSSGECRHLLAAAAGPGGLHNVRRLLARAWMTARAGERGAIGETDIAAAAEAA